MSNQTTISYGTPGAPLPPTENKLYYPALDGLRTVAILMVFFEHYLAKQFPEWLNWGWAGVDVFFVLSGFLITGILYDTRNTAHRYRNFYVRRTLRIFPLYYAIFAGLFLLKPILHWVSGPDFEFWLLYLGNFLRFFHIHVFSNPLNHLEHVFFTFHHQRIALRIGHFWSLAIEEQFYLVWPFVVFFIRDRVKLQRICFAVLAICPILRMASAYLLPHAFIAAEWNYRITVVRVDALLWGSLIALILRGPAREWLLRKASLIAWGGSFVFFAGWAATIYVLRFPWWTETIGYTFLDGAAAGFVLLAIQRTTATYHALSFRPLRTLGVVSYGFYVFHDIFHDFYSYTFQRLFPTLSSESSIRIGTAVIAFPATLLISYFSFKYFETPFLRLKDRFTIKPG